jgi:hypothetical protein
MATLKMSHPRGVIIWVGFLNSLAHEGKSAHTQGSIAESPFPDAFPSSAAHIPDTLGIVIRPSPLLHAIEAMHRGCGRYRAFAQPGSIFVT